MSDAARPRESATARPFGVRRGGLCRRVFLAAILSVVCCLGVWLLAKAIVKTDAYLMDQRLAMAMRSLAVGEEAPDIRLKDPEGRPFRLRDWIGRLPVVLELSSFT